MGWGHSRFAVFALLLLWSSPPATAAETPPPPQNAQELFRGLDFQSGRIDLRGGLATLTVGQNFSYLGAKDAETFLVKLWGNLPGAGSNSLGVLLPRDVDALGDDGWAVVIDYEESGYVTDSDANSIDYDGLLKDLQKSVEEENETRGAQGYAPMTLIGWAATPHYDPATHKLYWAKRLRVADTSSDTLNYDIRALGRHGVLVLNIVASIDQLAMIERRVPEILGMVDFKQGNTYAEYDPKVDEVAAYGIAGLIAGGVLAKVGFFKALLVGLLAFKKVVIVAAVAGFGAIATFFKRLFGRHTAA